MKVVGSGRQKGTPNKSTKDLFEKAQELNVDPFEILLLFASGNKEKLGLKEVSADLMFRAAKEAATYLYPRRKTFEESPIDGLSYEDYLRELQEKNSLL
jgi:hypothetical protein